MRILLSLYNSLTKKLEGFQPLDDKKVKMYTCGPSVYLLPHIGNYRTFLFEDILHRYLEYTGYGVERVMTITDVEDKAIAEARKEEKTVEELTDKNIKIFLEELGRLKAKIPEHIPRSSTTVDKAVYLLEVLLRKGYAYWYNHSGRRNVYYDPLKFKGFGELYGLDMRKWPKKKRRFHRDTYPGNRWNRGDFILWHGYKEGDKVYWDTSIGKGRPAWNVQDPAMVTQHLGFKADICCGGTDNLIRHHDYVKALIESVTDEPFAHYWLHASHLHVDGKKMSKSRGNIIYPRDLLRRGYQWRHIRFFLICGHYRRRLNFTFTKFAKVCERLDNLRQMVEKFTSDGMLSEKSGMRTKELVVKLAADFEKNMDNDLHVKVAFDEMVKTLSKLVTLKEKHELSLEDLKRTVAKIKAVDQVLQVIF